MRTPPNIPPATFATALQEFARVVGTEGGFARVVGKEWVFTSDEDLDLYRDGYSPLRGESDERVASAAVAPESTEQVQAVVRIANRYGIPLYTISTGRNLGYGGSAPAYSGSVVLDLKRMNRIIEVNDRTHYAVVEPGVSYFDLYKYIQERNLKVWIDCPDPGWGSLVGNALDHGVGYTATRFRTHFDAHCGMEVVLANGEILRTGMGAMPGSKTWHEFKLGFGPIIDGIFSQSNFGVVTKMGFWLMPQPDAMLQGSVLAHRYEDLHALIDTLNRIENGGIATGVCQIASPLLGIGDVQQAMEAIYHGPPKMDPKHLALIAGTKLGYSAELEQYGLEHKIPYWEISLTFYGTPKIVDAQWEAARELASKAIPTATFKQNPIVSFPLTEEQKAHVHLPQLGEPNLEMFLGGARSAFNQDNPGGGHMFFAPIVPRTGEAIIEYNRVLAEAVARDKIPVVGASVFSLPFSMFERSFFFLVGFAVTQDPEMNKNSVKAFRQLIRTAAERGWGEYRTPVIFQDQVMGTYSFNNNVLLRFHETLKDAVDPKGILSPGRYGIWPKHLREKA